MEINMKKDQPISGIACTVTNCEYHGEGEKCYADCIKVTTCDPVQQCSVECATFKPKAGQ